MRTFKTNFRHKGVPTFVSVTQLENGQFTVKLESVDLDDKTDPTKETVAAMQSPDLIVQRTKNGNWTILDQGSFDLNEEDLKDLGTAIENNAPGLI